MQRVIRSVALALVALAAGYLIARSARPSAHERPVALSRRASAPTFSVHYRRDWRTVAAPALHGLALSAPVAIGPGATARRMAIGTARVATVGTLPATFLHSLAGRPRAQTVALGAYRFDRYLQLRPRGSGEVVSLYLLATTRSTIVATCVSPHPDGTFTVDCERVLRTLTLAPGVQVSGQVDAAYALELNGILSSLSQARKADGPGLLADSLAERARAADRLAAAEDHAATTAERLSPGSATTANDMLVRSLRQAAGGYRALAAAAGRDDRSAYEAAQRTLQRAQGRLTTAFKTLARLGYALR